MSAAASHSEPGSPEASPAEATDGSIGAALRQSWRRLSPYLHRNRRYYTLCILAILAYNAAFVAIPMLVGRIVAAAEGGLGREEVAERSSVLLVVVIFGAGVRYVSRTMVFNAAREIEYEIRNDLFAHLQALPQSFYGRWRTGDLMSRCVNDLNSVRLLLGPGFLSLIQTPIMFAGVLVAMVFLSPTLTLLVIAPYPLFIGIARTFGRTMHARSLAVQVSLADLSNQLQESISAVAVVKAYAMEGEQQARFAEANEGLLRRHLALVRINAAMPTITALLPAIGMMAVLGYGGSQIAAGEMTLAVFFTFAMYIYQLTFPTFIMGWVVALLQRGAASLQRIDEILSVAPSIRDHEDLDPVSRLRGDIRFQNLTFGYSEAGREPVLRGIDLEIPAGTSLGIVGPVGSGKTTLASLIPRLYEVDEGQLSLDGVDVNRISLATLRSSIAMVPQDAFLFSMSLAENIAYGLGEADAERVEEAARRAQLAKDVADLPAGYATLVGERGVMLSGGQRQRTALARALALRPSILILDDTLSAVDAATEAAIQAELGDFFSGLTVIVVASRVSTVQGCDQIIVLEEGEICERGRHAELIQAGGVYAALAREQARAPHGVPGEPGGAAE